MSWSESEQPSTARSTYTKASRVHSPRPVVSTAEKSEWKGAPRCAASETQSFTLASTSVMSPPCCLVRPPSYAYRSLVNRP